MISHSRYLVLQQEYYLGASSHFQKPYEDFCFVSCVPIASTHCRPFLLTLEVFRWSIWVSLLYVMRADGLTVHRFSQLVCGFKLPLSPLYSPFRLRRIQFKSCASTWRSSLLSLLSFYLLPLMWKLGAILHQPSLWVLNSKGVLLYMVGHGHQKRLRLPLLTFCGGHVKERGVGKRVLHCTSLLFFLKFTLLFLWLNAAENWMAWQSRGGCFPWSRVRMEHIPGESCVNPSIDLVWNLPDLWNTLAD